MKHRIAYRLDIDGLRALAVVAVIINHIDANLIPSGYLGVDIFFVISGFVITSSLAGRTNTNLSTFLINFYVRRIKRLVPALVVFVLIMGILSALFLPAPNVPLKTGMASLFGFSNIYLYLGTTDYFSDVNNLNPFLHTWSLGVEEQFYFIYPIIFWLFRPTIIATGKKSNLFILVMACLFTVSLLAFIYIYSKNQIAAYYLMPTRFWELTIGGIFYFIPKYSSIMYRKLASLSPALPSFAIIGTLFLPPSYAIFATVAVVSLTAILIITLRPGTLGHLFFSNKYIVYIGKISYSLYLWHWGVLTFSHWTVEFHLSSVPFTILLIFILSTISYHFIENPLRQAQWSSEKSHHIFYGLSVSMAVCLMFVILAKPLHGKTYLPQLLNYPKPHHLLRTWWIDNVSGEYLEKCHVKREFSTVLLKECLNVPSETGGKVYIIGDSHARNYLPTVRTSFKEYSVTYLTMGHGCAFLPKIMAVNYTKVNCMDYVKETANYLMNNARQKDVIFIGQRLYGNKDTRQRSIYIDFIKSFAIRMQSNGVMVILLDGTYHPSMVGLSCLTVPWKTIRPKACSVSAETVTNAFSQFDTLAKDAAHQTSNLYYAPLRHGLCHKNLCGQNTASGQPIWHDEGHITEKAAIELSPLLQYELTKNGFPISFLPE